jgi:hypothetical protein
MPRPPQTPAAYLKRSYRKCTGPNIRLRLSHRRRRTSDKIYRFPLLIRTNLSI